MKFTKKENKEVFGAIDFCVKARQPVSGGLYRLTLLQVKRGRLAATDGHRLHYTPVKDIPDGLYEYEKKNSTITLTRVKEINFPDLNRAIPKRFTNKLKINRKEFLHRTKQVKILMDRCYKGIALTFNGNLKIRGVNPGIGDAENEMTLPKSVTPELQIGINCYYLAEALQGLTDKTVTIGLQGGNDSPLMIWDTQKTALIMPMRI